MKVSRLWIAVTLTLPYISLAVAFASYYVSYMEPNILDAFFIYRGCPLYWAIESGSYWSIPPYRHVLDFFPLNFFIDFVFWALLFQLPLQIYFHWRSRK